MAEPDTLVPGPHLPDERANVRRGLLLFLAVAFGMAWALWGLLWLRGGLAHPRSVVVLVVSMYAPALGVLAAWRLADRPALRLSGVRRRGPWRAYLWAYLLIPALLILGAALCVLVGVIWGVWHAPLIAIGYNYPGSPVLGPLLMVGFTVVYGVALAWLRARSGSVWPAALAHGAINAEAVAIAVFLTAASPLVGAPIGLVALLPAAACAGLLLWRGPWAAGASVPSAAEHPSDRAL